MTEPVFTAKQVKVIKLIARGYSDEEVAAEMGVSRSAIRHHNKAIRIRLGNVETKRREIPLTYMRLTGQNPYPTPKGVK